MYEMCMYDSMHICICLRTCMYFNLYTTYALYMHIYTDTCSFTYPPYMHLTHIHTYKHLLISNLM